MYNNIEEIMQLTTGLQVLFINDENYEGGLYTRGSCVGDSWAACAYKYDFFRLSPTTYTIKKPNLCAP